LRSSTPGKPANPLGSADTTAREDLVVLAEAAAAGANLEGSIVGKALYAGRCTLTETVEAMRRVDEAPRLAV